MTEWDYYKHPVRDERTGCLRWQGPINASGYGKCGNRYAHRVAWEREVGPIPAFHTLDHVTERCSYRDCVNVDHLEPVTTEENARRAARAVEQRSRTHCPQGHEYTPENIVWKGKKRNKRTCRKCHYMLNNARRAAHRNRAANTNA